MRVELTDHYQNMSVRLAPGVHEVSGQLGKYLVENGYAVEVLPEEEAIESDSDADESLGEDGDRDAEDTGTDDADYQAMTKGQLLNIATAGGLELSDRLTKQAIIDELIAHGKK
jgi:hypothetical protein